MQKLSKALDDNNSKSELKSCEVIITAQLFHLLSVLPSSRLAPTNSLKTIIIAKKSMIVTLSLTKKSS